MLGLEVSKAVFYTAFQDITYLRPRGHIYKGHNYWNNL